MISSLKKLILGVLLFIPAQNLLASGNILFMPSFIYLNEKVEQEGSTSERSSLYVNANFGLLLSANLGIAAKYFARLDNFKISADENGTSSNGANDLNTFGLGLFYDSKTGPYFGAYYLHDPKKKSGASDDEISYEEGYGYMIEAAYKIKAGSIELGPMITYAHLNYETRETTQTKEDLNGTWADTLILPFFGFWFYF